MNYWVYNIHIRCVTKLHIAYHVLRAEKNTVIHYTKSDFDKLSC